MTDEQNTIAALVRKTKQPVIVQDTASDARVEGWFADRYGIKSAMAFPLFSRDRVFGVLFYNHLTDRGGFSEAQD